jgi:ABC-type transport system substrate-binding protein
VFPTELLNWSCESIFSIAGIYFNYQTERGRSLSFRKFILDAIDKAELVKYAPGCKIATSFIPASMFNTGVFSTEFEHESEQIELLPSENRKKLVIPFFGMSGENEPAGWAKNLASQLEKAGLEVEFKQPENGIFKNGDDEFPFYLAGFIPDVASPLDVYRLFASDGPWLQGQAQFSNEYAKRLSKISDLKSSEVPENFADIEEFFRQNIIAIPLFSQPVNFWYDPKKICCPHPLLHGFSPHFQELQLVNKDSENETNFKNC